MKSTVVPIYEFSDLQNAQNIVGVTYELQNDINLARLFIRPSPLCSVSNPFVSILDGKDYALKNLVIFFGGIMHPMYGGLFTMTASSSLVCNLHLENVAIESRWACTGGIVGQNNGTISDCSVSGSIQGSNFVGGIVGDNMEYGRVLSCSCTAEIKGTNDVGGIVGHNKGNAYVEKCYSTGVITGQMYVGRIIGFNRGTFRDCRATGYARSYYYASETSKELCIGQLAGKNFGEYIDKYGFVYENYDLNEVL